MLRLGIIAVLLCSQLIAPAMSGRFVCLAANGCICVDSGPKTCTCCKPLPKISTSCSCGCHQETPEPVSGLDGGCDGCAHIAVGDYQTPVGQHHYSIDTASLALPLATCEPVAIPTTTSFSQTPLLSADSATLAVIATVVLRI
jgi:hypothetical protein